MFTLVIHSEYLKDRVVKSLEGFDNYKINNREDGACELYFGTESEDDVIINIEE